ncbi:MAG: 50S ribosomal protein L18 [Bacillales bacterium]|jgi:large subunit ribosomal protein L18|nr:50S ribosomal protein L18 [Bacillales bacterium]
MIKKIDKKTERARRHFRIRQKIEGTADRPRLSVFRSNVHIYAQIIDDVKQVTLVATSSLALKLSYGGNVEAGKVVGTKIAELAKEKGISSVVFDRGGANYHGRVKALADAAREAGLSF